MEKQGTIHGRVRTGKKKIPIVKAEVVITNAENGDRIHAITDAHGRYRSPPLPALPKGSSYRVDCDVFGFNKHKTNVKPDDKALDLDFGIELGLVCLGPDRKTELTQVTAGTRALLQASTSALKADATFAFSAPWPLHDTGDPREKLLPTDGLDGNVPVSVTLEEVGSASITASTNLLVVPVAALPITGQIGVNLKRAGVPATEDQALWLWIRNRTNALRFNGSGYHDFIDRVFTVDRTRLPGGVELGQKISDLGTQIHGVGAYELLKTATQIFLLLECGVTTINNVQTFGHQDPFDPSEETGRLGAAATTSDISQRLQSYLGKGLPYIERVVRNAFPNQRAANVFGEGVLATRIQSPCLLELIWSYWHEEGMLVQTMNAISRRFQNVRAPGDRDPLAHLEIDPLRPLNNLLWGYIQDEQNLLTVKRRAYEYDHHYGLTIYGKAVPTLRPADSRSKFLEAFHNLLHMTSVFYKEDNDTTVIADGFPLLNALKEVHLMLAQGAHNQFGDLPWTARAEMLMQQWLLARPEMRDFLQSRPMVPYKEGWMGQVDTMKSLQGWSDVTVTHFHDLGAYGEQILLSVRYGDWIGVNDEDSAKNWARYWRPEIQGYLHAYRAVTGVDLTNPEGVDYTMPAVHLQKRLAMQRAR